VRERRKYLFSNKSPRQFIQSRMLERERERERKRVRRRRSRFSSLSRRVFLTLTINEERETAANIYFLSLSCTLFAPLFLFSDHHLTPDLVVHSLILMSSRTCISHGFFCCTPDPLERERDYFTMLNHTHNIGAYKQTV
jgi:hypothetical protein